MGGHHVVLHTGVKKRRAEHILVKVRDILFAGLGKSPLPPHATRNNNDESLFGPIAPVGRGTLCSRWNQTRDNRSSHDLKEGALPEVSRSPFVAITTHLRQLNLIESHKSNPREPSQKPCPAHFVTELGTALRVLWNSASLLENDRVFLVGIQADQPHAAGFRHRNRVTC